MALEKKPNRSLAQVVTQAGLSNTSFAARIRVEAKRRGIDASPDHVSVKRWLDGTQPHDDTIQCIVAVLSAKLGREVSFSEIGYEVNPQHPQGDPIADSAHYPADPGRAVELLDTLASADMADSSGVMRSDWVSETAPSVITGYLFSSPTWQKGHGPLVIANSAVAERIRSFTRHLMDLDFRYGGGHVRRTLLFYFRSEIVPLLHEPYPDPVRREIFSATAEVAQLLGWSAYDAGRHGAAQRYFMQGLRLAGEAGDSILGARILSNLSHQANYLGRYNEAIQFARAAQSGAGGYATPTVYAMLLAMEARALASSGDTRTCAQVLNRAEKSFAQRNPTEEPEWIRYFDALELAGETAHCFRELGRPYETQMFAVQAIDPLNTPPRTRAFISMVNAAGALRAGNLDESLSLANSALSLTGSLQSSRYIRYLTDFHRSLAEAHVRDPAARQFMELLAKAYPRLSLPDVL